MLPIEIRNFLKYKCYICRSGLNGISGLCFFAEKKMKKIEEKKNEQRLINVILLDVFLGQPSLPGRICSNTF